MTGALQCMSSTLIRIRFMSPSGVHCHQLLLSTALCVPTAKRNRHPHSARWCCKTGARLICTYLDILTVCYPPRRGSRTGIAAASKATVVPTIFRLGMQQKWNSLTNTNCSVTMHSRMRYWQRDWSGDKACWLCHSLLQNLKDLGVLTLLSSTRVAGSIRNVLANPEAMSSCLASDQRLQGCKDFVQGLVLILSILSVGDLLETLHHFEM